MTKRTYRLTPGLDRALTRHARAQRIAPAVVVRDALSAYLMITTANNDIAHHLATLREQQQHLAALIGRVVGHDDAPRDSTTTTDPQRSVNRVLDRLQQQRRDK
jgi:predicted transcriptional regulator